MPQYTPTLSRAVIEKYVSFFGIDFGGDIANWTVYRNKNGKVVIFPKTRPEKPPTPSQLQQRARFRAAHNAFAALAGAEKKRWEDLARSLYLCMTGQNLYISLSLKDRSDFWPRVVRLTGTTLALPKLVPY